MNKNKEIGMMDFGNDKPYIDFETERLDIRNAVKEDKEEYMALRVNNSDIQVAYELFTGFEDYEWEGELLSDEDIHLSVFLKQGNTFVASASIQNFREPEVEIGYDVEEKHRNQGIASEIVFGLLSELHRLFPDAKAVIRVDKDNAASKKVAEKCGAVLLRREDSFASRAFSIAKEAFEKDGSDFENAEKYKDMRELMEKGRDSVYVYLLP